MDLPKPSPRVADSISKSFEYCRKYRHQYLMPEHLLAAFLHDDNFSAAIDAYYDFFRFSDRVEEYVETIESVPEDINYEPEMSYQLSELYNNAMKSVILSDAKCLDTPHLAQAMINLNDSWAAYILKDCLGDKEVEFMKTLIDLCEDPIYYVPDDDDDEIADIELDNLYTRNSIDTENDDADDDTLEDPLGTSEPEKTNSTQWKKLVTDMNDQCYHHNHLVGREREMERTIRVLCRRDKNNPLHIGEPGVGKTALVWGLAQLIEKNQVPSRLKGSHIYQLDLGTLLAGTQYRGDFENRIKMIMSGIEKESTNNIVYIDEIHTLVGTGATGDSAMDASNLFKPYLESGNIRFIGSTTYEEYNRYLSRSKGMIRRFQQIDIAEPSIDEAKEILRQLKPSYEYFHGVEYADDAIDFAVEASAKHITDRRLPDKAIDLIDEAGAAAEIAQQKHEVCKKDIADVLAKICKVDALSEAAEDDYQKLETLAPRMLSQIYGQDDAIHKVTEAIQMSRAGLLDDNKPLASLLFVGPTGVGKTEVAKVLAHELGIELVRFDMSEYTEKHTVAKLIGSPAGYVGYEDGGLLTDAIRKSPNCVLLLDEIEKAHQDIYNIMLQVMDYARLTDNKGHHADFRNVVIIMTSNAGAQYASQGQVGFNSSVSRGEAMMRQVKKTFKPEFINRLSGTVVFNDMDRHMATLILQKKLRDLDAKLAVKHVKLQLSPSAFDYLLAEGFTAEYGAREMDRVIAQRLKPLLMREILFGSLKNGGTISVELKDGSLSILHNT